MQTTNERNNNSPAIISPISLCIIPLIKAHIIIMDTDTITPYLRKSINAFSNDFNSLSFIMSKYIRLQIY